MKGPRARRAALVAGLVAGTGALVACSAILGLPGEVTIVDPDAGEAGTDAATDAAFDAYFDPTSVFGTSECQQCLTLHCKSESAACAANAACAGRNRCLSTCARNAYFGPECYEQCTEDFPEDDTAAAIDKAFLATCANKACRPECKMGRDFSCLNQYTWPTPEPNATQVTIGFHTVYEDLEPVETVPVVAGTVTPCNIINDTWPCAPGGPHQATIANGSVSLTLPLGGVMDHAAWSGYFLFQGSGTAQLPEGGILFTRNRPEWADRPKDASAPKEKVPFPTASVFYGLAGLYTSGLFEPADPDAGTVIGGVEDCRTILGVFADDMRVTMTDAPLVRIRYLDANHVPDDKLTVTSSSGAFIILNAPRGRHTIALTKSDAGTPVASIDMYIQPGKITQLGIWPATKPQ